jgi:hypothetical protein
MGHCTYLERGALVEFGPRACTHAEGVSSHAAYVGQAKKLWWCSFQALALCSLLCCCIGPSAPAAVHIAQ